MSWWRRLFGGKPQPAANPLPAVRVPFYHDVLPGKLAVRVWVHDAPLHGVGVPCWSYVTDGLRALGQKEIIFTLRRRPDEAEDDYPRDPLRFFADVYRLAGEGRLVDAGGYTRFRLPDGFLGCDGIVGLAYVPAETLPGVSYPAPPLAAILLTPEEAELVQMAGSYRVLTLLGQRHRYYPTPPWSERDRDTVLGKDHLAQSLLGMMPAAHAPWASVRLTSERPAGPPPKLPPGQYSVAPPGQRLVLRVREAELSAPRGLLEQIPAESALALITAPDPSANARLVWRPGQQQLEAISPAGSDGSRITGQFVAFLPLADAEEGGQAVEDGFVVQLRPESWAGLRGALAGGSRFAVGGQGGRTDFVLEWERKAQPGGPVEVVAGLLYQPDEVLKERIASSDAFAEFVGRIDEVVRDYFAGLPEGPGQGLTLVVALRPGPEARFWAEFIPGGVAAEVVAGLHERLRELPPPPVRRGPVAFASQIKLWGGPPPGQGPFVFIPREWEEACDRPGGSLIPDDPLARIWPS